MSESGSTPPNQKRHRQDESCVRLTARHFPSLVPPSGKKQNATRKCVVCARKIDQNGKSVRRESRYQCNECNVALCVVPCFSVYHTKQNF